MIEWKEVPKVYLYLFAAKPDRPVKILCASETHQRPLALYITGEAFPVLMYCTRYFSETGIVHFYHGQCPVCGAKYIYSPDATPAEMEMAKQAAEELLPTS